MPAIHIFKAGTHTDMHGTKLPFTQSDLAACVKAYDPSVHEAPLVIGHPKTEDPAWGWVKSLSLNGGDLLAEPDQLDPQFAELVGNGRFKKVSASFYLPDSPNNPKPGTLYLRHVGFLGAQPPSIKGLKQVSFGEKEEGVVEFADWNGERIGRGCSTSGSKMNNGQTDAMGYHTGTTAASRDSYGFTQYRNIEGWWDNVYDWMDGCYYNSNGLNVITNPNNFSDNANGTLVGTPSSGYPSDFTIPTASGLEWALFPSAANGSTTTYVPDNWLFYGSSPCLRHGGDYDQSQSHGPFYVVYSRTSYSGDGIGCRLQERPPKAA